MASRALLASQACCPRPGLPSSADRSAAATAGGVLHEAQGCRASRCFGMRATLPRRAAWPRGMARYVLAQSADAGAGPSASAKAAGRSEYRPKNYDVICTDVANALQAAMADGHLMLEAEFPPLPSSVSNYKGSSDSYIDANLQLALQVGRKIAAGGQRKVHILLPDKVEADRARKVFVSSLAIAGEEGVTLGALDFSWSDDFADALASFFKGPHAATRHAQADADRAAAAAADVHLVCNVSAVELPLVETYAPVVKPGASLVLFNLELDTLRADLGLLGFPPKALHLGYLSRFLPAFYVRQRDYSKSVPAAPFVLNYSGALFREYPGPWQIMLRTDGGSLACVAEQRGRPTLGAFKVALQTAMGIAEVPDSAASKIRDGYRQTTWWEDASGRAEEASPTWRS